MATIQELGRQIRLDSFSSTARKVWASAEEEARRLNHGQINSGHIFLGLIKDESVIGMLGRLHIDQQIIRDNIESLLEQKSREVPQTIGFTDHIGNVIKKALNETTRRKNIIITPIDLLIGVILEGEEITIAALKNQEQDTLPSLAGKIRNFIDNQLLVEAREASIRDRLERFLRNPNVNRSTMDSTIEILNNVMDLAENPKQKPESESSA